MACVNRNSKAFKQLAKDANISETQLESIVHEFINQEGYDGKSYPSIDYINQKVNGKETLCGEQAYNLWEKEYNKPIVVDNMQEAQPILKQLGQIFDTNAIGLKQTNDNKIEISVRKPVKVAETAFNEHETKLVGRRQDENLRQLLDNEDVSLQNLVDYVKNKSNDYNVILNILEQKGLLKDISVQLHCEADINFVPDKHRNADTNIGREAKRAYFKNNTIHVNANAEFVDGNASSVIMHEIMHAVTVNKLAANAKLREAFYDIIKIYQEKSEYPYPIAHQYDYKNSFSLSHGIAEFVADIWSDPTLINELKRIEIEENGKKLKLWDKVKHFFSDLFTGELFKGIKDKSLMAQASNTMLELLESTEEVSVNNESFHEHGDNKTEEGQRFIAAVSRLRNSMNQVELANLQRDVANAMSDIITDAFEHPEKYEQLSSLSKNDIAKMTRSQMVQALGVDNFMNTVFQAFAGNKSLKFAKTRLLLTQSENWNTITKLAMTNFKEHEGFSIVLKDVIDESMTNNEESFNEDQSESEVAEREGDTQEHWQIEARTVETEASLSQKVREALNQCYLLEKNANGELVKVKTDNAIDRRIELKDAVYQILSWTEGTFSLNEMIEKLQAQTEKNPWITQILEKLQDTSGKYADFQSQFFNNFCKSMQLYSVVRRKGNKLISTVVNRNSANKNAMDNIIAAFNIGQHPMFTSAGVVNKTELDNFSRKIDELNSLTLDANTISKISELAASAVASLGFTTSQDLFAQALTEKTYKDFVKNLQNIKEKLQQKQNDSNYSPFVYNAEGSILNYVKNAITPVTNLLNAVNVNVTIDNGKMYQSRVIPSYLTKLMSKFSQKDQAAFEKFIQEEYGKYEWFAEEDANGNLVYRNVWLYKLMRDPNVRKNFEHKVQLNYNKKRYMKEMNAAEYAVSLIAEYFSETKNNTDAIVPAWFRIPMLSNKPSSEFLKFDSYRGKNYKDQLVNGFFKVFEQELSRIQTCQRRKDAGITKGDKRFIKNFDVNGHKFQLLDFMQEEVDNSTELGQLINKKVNETKEEPMTSAELLQLTKLAKEKIKESIDKKADDILQKWEENGVIAKSTQIEGVNKNKEKAKEDLRNFIWNDAFASTQIMELTITDPAYYKDAEDLQKRMAEIHAPGNRGNINAIDYNGKAVTDGTLRTIYIKDSEIISNIIDNISIVFDRKIASATSEQQKRELEILKESLVGENGAYKAVNVTDAQAYTGLTAVRKKALMLGKWSQEKEDLYQKIKKGEKYNPKDVIALSQILKPFVYTQIEKSANAADVPMSHLKVPVQNKNSEYLLMMADALLANEETSKPNVLKVISEIMEESEKGEVADGKYVAGTKGIDVIQFNSTVKSGEQGVIDINNLQSEEEIKNKLKKIIYGVDNKGNIQENIDANYDLDVVHHYPAEDYAEQQSVPEHFKDHEQIFGSQIRAIIKSDQQNAIYIMPDGRQLNAKEFKEEYERTIAENIQISIDKLKEELKLDELDSKHSNEVISQILQREILSNPRYGIDMAIACSIDPQTGKFNIPLGDPLQSKRIEQLINSIVKNRINKQKIAGGHVVQVSNFGTSESLKIRFKNKQTGGVLLTKEEFEKKGIVGSYENYVQEHQGGIAYWEVLAPIYDDRLLNFADKDGTINIKAIEKFNPELLQMIGYRIPTEDKYSMAPLKIVGFLPREAGDAIMLPAEITTITGSDFDVDKFYLMRKDVPFNRAGVTRINLYNAILKSSDKEFTEGEKQKIWNTILEFSESPMSSKYNNSKLFETYLSLAFEQKESDDIRVKNNNHLIDMMTAVLTSEHNTDTMLNPGGFEEQKKMGYVIQAMKTNPQLKYDDLMQTSIDELKKLGYRSKNLIFIDEQVNFYQQNSAAGSLIGIFATNKASHAMYEGDGMIISQDIMFDKEEKSVGFAIGSTKFSKTDSPIVIDTTIDSNGNSVSKTLGSMLAASADAVKDPVLNLMNVNQNTANILVGMVRVGVPFEEAALFLAQKPIVDLIQEVENSKLTKRKFINDLVNEKTKKYVSTKLYLEDLTKEEMIKNINNPTEESAAKALIMLKRMTKLANVVSSASLPSKFNSITSAVGPLIIDNLIMDYKLDKFPKGITDAFGHEMSLDDILNNHPILDKFYQSYIIAQNIFSKMNMPLNSVQFKALIATFPEELQPALLNDRKLLSQLGNFYLSYKLINDIDNNGNKKAPVIDSKKLAYYKTDFIKDYLKESKKFSSNPLIQAIKITTNTNTGYVDLKLDLKGLSIVEKDRLTAGWAELWKGEGKELATKLFEYNFFKGGIDFSPKTFISLMPLQMRQELTGYTDAFENESPINPALIVDLFIRNNSDNIKLVPVIKELKHTEDSFSSETFYGRLFKSANGTMYGVTQLEGVEGEAPKFVYTKVEPLGVDGFMDISTTEVKNATKRTQKEVEKNTRQIKVDEMSLEELAAMMTEVNMTEANLHIEDMSIEDASQYDQILYESTENTIDESIAEELDVTEQYDNRFEDANTLKEILKEMSPQTFLNSAYTLRERQAYQQMPAEIKAEQKDKILESMKEKASKFSNFKFDDNFFNECLDKLC